MSGNAFPSDQIAPRIITADTWNKIHDVGNLVTLANNQMSTAATQAANAEVITEAGEGVRANFQGLTGEASDEANTRQAKLTLEAADKHTRMATLVGMLSTSANGALAGFDGLIAEYNAALPALKARGDAEHWTQEEFRQAEQELVDDLKSKADALGDEHDANADTIGAAMGNPDADPSTLTRALGSGNAAANTPQGLDPALQNIMGQLTGQLTGAQQQASGLANKGVDAAMQLAQSFGRGDPGTPITPEALDLLTGNQPGGDAPAAQTGDEPPVDDEGAAPATPVDNPAADPSAPAAPAAPPASAAPAAPAAAPMVDGGAAPATAHGAAPAAPVTTQAPASAPAEASPPSAPVQTDLSSATGGPAPSGGVPENHPQTAVQAPTQTRSPGDGAPSGTTLSSAGPSPMTTAPASTAVFGPSAGGSPAFGSPSGAASASPAMSPIMGSSSLTTPMGPPPVTAPPAPVAPVAVAAPAAAASLSAQSAGAGPAHGPAAGPSSMAPAQPQNNANNANSAAAGAIAGAPPLIGAAPVAVGVPMSRPSGGFHTSIGSLSPEEREGVGVMLAVKRGLRLAGVTSAVAVGMYPDGKSIFSTIDGLGYLPDGTCLPAGAVPMMEYVSDTFLVDHTGCDRPSVVMRRAADLGLIPMPRVILSTDRNPNDDLVTAIAPSVLKEGSMPQATVTRATSGASTPPTSTP